MITEKAVTQREFREILIREAVRDFAELHVSQGAALDRLTEPATLEDAADTTFNWTGIHPAAVRGGQAIMQDEAQRIQAHLQSSN